MENIDDLMRQKFDSDDPGERFEFQEEYWEQAQALLDLEEQKRRRRFWLLLGLLLLVGLLLSLLLLRGTGGLFSKNETEKENQQISTQLPVPSSNQNKGFSTEHSTLQNNTTNSNQPTNQALNTTPTNTQSANQGAGFTKDVSNTRNPKNTLKQSDRQKLAKKGLHFDQYGNAVERFSQSTALIDASNTAANGPSKGQPMNQNEVGKESVPEAVENQEMQVADPNSTTTPIGNAPNGHAEPLIRLIQINTLLTPLFPFPIPERVIVPQTKPAPLNLPIAEKTKPEQGKRFSMGLSLAGTTYSPKDTNGKWAGWTLGAYGAYKLNKTWSLSLGAQWRFVPGHGAFTAPSDSTNPEFSEQLRYSFGYQRETWKAETRGLHYLELPISARWQKGRLGLEAGAAAGFLLAVQNRTEYTQESSLEPATTTIKKFVAGKKEGYNGAYLTTQAGGVYRLNNRFSVYAKGQYRFTPVLKNATEGLGNVDLGLQVRLF